MNFFPKATFLCSCSCYKKRPKPILPTVGFCGRSNVGKSSLINSLLGRKSLANISSKPGKTRCLNFYEVGKKWHWVDLPGYGWARVGKSLRASFGDQIQNFILYDPGLVQIFFVIDARHSLQGNDLSFLSWLIKYDIPFQIIATKIDVCKRAVLCELERELICFLEEKEVKVKRLCEVSSVTKRGVEDLQKSISLLLNAVISR